MAQRLELHAYLVDLLGSDNVYFQPPPTVKMRYPCIIYQRDNVNTDFADNKPYNHKRRYQVIVVSLINNTWIPHLHSWRRVEKYTLSEPNKSTK